jgi:hypothetical protein
MATELIIIGIVIVLPLLFISVLEFITDQVKERQMSVLVPKTNTIPAQAAYLQMLTMCSDINVKPESLKEALDRLEKLSEVQTGITRDEFFSVLRYFQWVYGNIERLRYSTVEYKKERPCSKP